VTGNGWFIVSPANDKINTSYDLLLGFFETREKFEGLWLFCNTGEQILGKAGSVRNYRKFSDKNCPERGF
jgi:hypothetical protein